MSVVRLGEVPSAVVSPLSSDTTAFQTVAKPEPGSSVNDASPWFSQIWVGTVMDAGTTKASVHMVIHKCGQDDRQRAATQGQRPAIPVLKTTS